MKKKILFTAHSLIIGGIETSLINLLNNLDEKKYDITLILQKKEGEFLDCVPKHVKIIEYKISNNKNIIIRKIINRLKLISFVLKNYKKYDFAGCYATYSIPSSYIARGLGKKSAFWVHADYYYVYNKNKKLMTKFFVEKKINRFNNIVFVSNESKKHFINCFPKLKNKCLTINNLLDYEKVIKKSLEKIKYQKTSPTVFINISRHEEEQKKITRLINSIEILSKKNLDFKVILIGDGPDHKKYKKIIKDKKLDKYADIMGPQKNPYPYLKIADCFILTSDYEGFPVVFTESLILNIPIISTINVSDNQIDIKKMGNIIALKDSNDIAEKMEQIINKKLIINKFSPELYNSKLLKDVENLINTD